MDDATDSELLVLESLAGEAAELLSLIVCQPVSECQ